MGNAADHEDLAVLLDDALDFLAVLVPFFDGSGIRLPQGWLVLCEQNRRKTEGDALVFPHPRTGGYLPAANLTKRLYSAMRKAGIPAKGEHGRSRNFHSFRHTFARIALENGEGDVLGWVSGQLGHSSIQLTKGTYGRWSREAERAQAKSLEGAFNV
jgi:integrase